MTKITSTKSIVSLQTILSEKDIRVKQGLIEDFILNSVPHLNPFLYATDSYKVSHIKFEIPGVKEIYSNFTPRFAKYLREMLGELYDDKYVVFGIQWMMLRLHMMAKVGFFDRPWEEVLEEMKEVHTPYIGNDIFDHFEKLHKLGYLPIAVKTLAEGTVAPVGVPFLTVRNTLPEFEWLPNYLETIFSTDLWKELTVATVARIFRQLTNNYAMQTVGNLLGTEWQGHDFHVRGASGYESAAINGAAFLTSSCGTDNLPSLWAAKKFYFSTNNEGLLAGSVSAGEHSVTTLGILTEQEKQLAILQAESDEVDVDEAVKNATEQKLKTIAAENGIISLVEAEYIYKRWLLTERFPTGILSDVADSFDYWSHLSVNVLKLKDVIMSREGKYVVRGDSGDPVDVICGYEDLDIADAVARRFAEQAVVGKTFAVKDQKYLVLKKPELTSNKYLPLFELVRNEFVKPISSEEEIRQAIVDLQESRNQHEPKTIEFIEQQIKNLEDSIVEYANLEHVVVAAEEKGSIEVLWEIFGGTITEKGYKLLDSHIGMIYGDGITVNRASNIFRRLEKKGFASINIVYGIGSYSLNMLGRDHLGMAIKATNAVVDIEGNEVDKPIYKDPKTDTSKKSARGLIRVFKDDKGNITFADEQTRDQEEQGLLEVVYKDGQFQKFTTLFEIRNNLWPTAE